MRIATKYMRINLREKCPCSEFSRSVFSRIRIKCECWKIQTRKTSNTENFQAVLDSYSRLCPTSVMESFVKIVPSFYPLTHKKAPS